MRSLEDNYWSVWVHFMKHNKIIMFKSLVNIKIEENTLFLFGLTGSVSQIKNKINCTDVSKSQYSIRQVADELLFYAYYSSSVYLLKFLNPCWR